MICRDGSVGAADQTAPINGYEPPVKIDYVVVIEPKWTASTKKPKPIKLHYT